MFNMIDYEKNMAWMRVSQTLNRSLVCQNLSDRPYCIIPVDNKYNKEYIKEFNIPVVYSSHRGGALVLFPNDIAWTWFTDIAKMKPILEDILAYLKEFNNEFYIDGNDIMYGENKVLGSMSVGEGLHYEGIFFSFNSDVEIIKNVTLKEINKAPIGLAEFGIEPNHIIQMIEMLIDKYGLAEYNSKK